MRYSRLTGLGTAAVAATVALPAQAEIKLTGKVQAEVVNVSGDGFNGPGGEGTKVTDAMRRDGLHGGNATSLGVKGKKDLGDGYAAIGRIRIKPRPGLWGYNKTKGKYKAPGNKDSLFSGRDAFAGIKTPYGSLTAGTMSTPYKSATVKWDPFKGTFMQARGQGGMSRAQNSYMPNTLAYTKKVAGAKIKAAAILDERDTDGDGEADGDNGYSAMAVIPAGPVDVALAWQDLGKNFEADNAPADSSGGANGPDDGATSYKAALRFKPGAWTLVAQYEHTDNYAINYGNDGDFVFGSAKYKVSKHHQVAANVGTFSDGYDEDDKDYSGNYAAGSYEYHFTKKVKSYVGFTYSTSEYDGDYTTIGTGTRIKF